jgi:hypothetical protein
MSFTTEFYDYYIGRSNSAEGLAVVIEAHRFVQACTSTGSASLSQNLTAL